MSTKNVIFALPGNEGLSVSIAKHLGAETGKAEIRRFPDGESYVRLDTNVKEKKVIMVCTLHRPDEKLLPLYFLSRTAMELGAKCTCLVAPYLAYMRQDKRFKPGEGITSAYFAHILSEFAESLITVDPHLHRRSSLGEIYTIPTTVLHAAPAISDWIRKHVERPVLIGPDSESEQWVSEVARAAEAPHIVLEKTRHGDREVEISVPQVAEYLSHTPVLVDDIISTARTMAETILHLRNAGLKPPVCIGVHGVFAGGAIEALETSGAGKIITCNTIVHPTNGIDLSKMISKELIQ